MNQRAHIGCKQIKLLELLGDFYLYFYVVKTFICSFDIYFTLHTITSALLFNLISFLWCEGCAKRKMQYAHEIY